ncbi:MAG: SpvB/TcaC N-terminal domain-containing protein [Bacteroidota bacterium]|nr:SpvB/TcaC N-terminal domain-containing protein [Bacteroidota bacterium]
MKEQSQSKSSSSFLITDGGKTKSNAIEVPSISLPKGGGAIKGIDEKFFVNAVNGTSSFSIPLPFSKARGATPELSLSYSSYLCFYKILCLEIHHNANYENLY